LTSVARRWRSTGWSVTVTDPATVEQLNFAVRRTALADPDGQPDLADAALAAADLDSVFTRGEGRFYQRRIDVLGARVLPITAAMRTASVLVDRHAFGTAGGFASP
jgi:hypothetical protein